MVLQDSGGRLESVGMMAGSLSILSLSVFFMVRMCSSPLSRPAIARSRQALNSAGSFLIRLGTCVRASIMADCVASIVARPRIMLASLSSCAIFSRCLFSSEDMAFQE